MTCGKSSIQDVLELPHPFLSHPLLLLPKLFSLRSRALQQWASQQIQAEPGRQKFFGVFEVQMFSYVDNNLFPKSGTVWPTHSWEPSGGLGSP